MRTYGSVFRLGQNLALIATLFGGLFLGAGNMLSLYLDPGMAEVLHGRHAAHGEDTAPEDWLDPALVTMNCGDTLEGVLFSPLAHGDHPDHLDQHDQHDQHDQVQVLPAHCLFCLDGIAPQPVDLLGAFTSPAVRPVLPASASAESVLHAQRYLDAHPRAPPCLLA